MHWEINLSEDKCKVTHLGGRNKIHPEDFITISATSRAQGHKLKLDRDHFRWKQGEEFPSHKVKLGKRS